MAAAARKGPMFLFRARPVSIALGAFIDTPEMGEHFCKRLYLSLYRAVVPKRWSHLIRFVKVYKPLEFLGNKINLQKEP